jgi:hypothetical protein
VATRVARGGGLPSPRAFDAKEAPAAAGVTLNRRLNDREISYSRIRLQKECLTQAAGVKSASGPKMDTQRPNLVYPHEAAIAVTS